MAKIRIISNPYEKKTIFQSRDKSTGEWIEINEENNTNSGLLQDKLRTGFFPFKAREIVDLIVQEYYAGDGPVEIVFEGTSDEYADLCSVCRMEEYEGRVKLKESGRYLENARDILPDIISIYEKVRPFVEENIPEASDEEIREILGKFSDASNDIIPLCVIGSYSSGKSTFINALVGYELLPSGDEPTTAKVYKIAQSKVADQATVQFQYEGRPVCISLTADTAELKTDPADNELSGKLAEQLAEVRAEPIPVKLKQILQTINTYVNRQQDGADPVDDLIEICTPFDEDGLWGRIPSKFEIFDTPGSNSASNRDHYEVLKKALGKRSNGIPIFVSENETLDTQDNESLFQDINELDGFDNRFTMIVVNKADQINFSGKKEYDEADRARVLDQTVPRNLYSAGIYFVSSIMGMGAKNDEEFLEDHTAEIFEDQRNKYANPKSRFYKQLFRYNIQPEQLRRMYALQAERHENVIYANSGLYSIELAIETFARVYSSYDKCQQSCQFLEKVLSRTGAALAESKAAQEEARALIETQLEKDTKALIDQLKSETSEQTAQFCGGYPALEDWIKKPGTNETLKELRALESDYRRTQAKETGVGEKRSEVTGSVKALGKTFAANVSSAIGERNRSAVQEIGTGIAGGTKDIFENIGELRETQKETSRAVADDLIVEIRSVFAERLAQTDALLCGRSQIYWEACAKDLKNTLAKSVENAKILSDEKKNRLSVIIQTYAEDRYELQAEKIFEKEYFRHLFGDRNRLNIVKLANCYDQEMESRTEELYDFYRQDHEDSFAAWKNGLLDTILANIVDYSPELQEKSESIRRMNEQIAAMEAKQRKLNSYSAQIERMLAWKED